MDRIPPIKFLTTRQTEANRVLHSAIQSINGFYYRHNFAVLPYLISGNPSTVYLPNLEYTSVKDFWHEVNKIKDTSPLNYSPHLISKVEKLLPNQLNLHEKEIQAFKKNWEKAEKPFWKFVYEVLPQHVSNITEIEVRITSFGTKTSFEKIDPIEKKKFNCYIRKDMTIANIGEAIIQGLLYSEQKKLNIPWEGIESIADFLIQRLVDIKIFPTFHPTISPLKRQSNQLITESAEYMASLGLYFEKQLKKELISST